MIIVLMGVTGTGKSTIGRALAESLGWTFLDADEFHSPANIEKMKTGIPLSDLDRKPWLEDLRAAVHNSVARNESAVLACSALKESYRQFLLRDNDAKLVYLKGDYGLIKERLRNRRDHYMNPDLLDSQIQTLEEPADCLEIDVSAEPLEIVDIIRKHLNS